jgi:hypothetical protein
MNSAKPLSDANRAKSGGKYPKGVSGNPAGRPVGIVDRRARLRAMVESEGEAIIQTLLDQALAGDGRALALVASQLLPTPPKATLEPIELDGISQNATLADIALAVAKSAAAGRLSPDHAAALVTMLRGAAELADLAEIKAAVERLEAHQ